MFAGLNNSGGKTEASNAGVSLSGQTGRSPHRSVLSKDAAEKTN